MLRHVCKLAIGAALLSLCAFPTEAQQLPTFGRNASRIITACENTIRAELFDPQATMGDIREACVCVDRALTAAAPEIPRADLDRLFKTIEGIERFAYWELNFLQRDRNPEVVNLAIEDFHHNVLSCIGPVGISGSTGRKDSAWPSPERVVPAEGPARPRERGVGGLYRVTYGSAREATLVMMGSYPGPYSREREARGYRYHYELLTEELSKEAVLGCTYDVGQRLVVSDTYWIWFNGTPAAYLAQRDQLPSDHPLHLIRALPDGCPRTEAEAKRLIGIQRYVW